MLDFVTLALVVLSTLLIAAFWLLPSSKKINTIPGINPSDKEAGNIGDIAKAGSLHEFLMKLHGQYGKIVGFWFGQTYTVSIASPELFKQTASIFDRPHVLFKMFEPLIGPAALHFTNGSEGKIRRQYYDRAFSGERMMALYETVQKCVDDFIEELELKTEEGGIRVPLLETNLAFSVKTALHGVLGQDSIDDVTLDKFQDAYETAWYEMESRLSDPIPPDENRIKKFKEAVNMIKATVQKVTEHRKATVLQGTLVIDEIMESAANSDIIDGDSITYLVGAFHTTTCFLSWCLHYLSCNEDVQERLYKEIIDVLGDKGLVDETNIGQLRYMRQVLNETLRCSVIGPFAARYQDFDSNLGGHVIPKNTPILQAMGVVHLDKDLWPDPTKFDPERFNAVNSRSRHPYAFQPFGFAGKRKCPGYKFTYQESTVFLATMLRKFKVKKLGDQVVKHKYGLVTGPAEEIYVQIIKRI